MIRIRVVLARCQVETTGRRRRRSLHPGAPRRLRSRDGDGREGLGGAGPREERQDDQKHDGHGREDPCPPDGRAPSRTLAFGLARTARLFLALAPIGVGAASGGCGRCRPLRGRPRPLLLRRHHAGGTKLAGTGFGTWSAEPNARTITSWSLSGICVGSPVHSLPLTYARRVECPAAHLSPRHSFVR